MTRLGEACRWWAAGHDGPMALRTATTMGRHGMLRFNEDEDYSELTTEGRRIMHAHGYRTRRGYPDFWAREATPTK